MIAGMSTATVNTTITIAIAIGVIRDIVGTRMMDTLTVATLTVATLTVVTLTVVTLIVQGTAVIRGTVARMSTEGSMGRSSGGLLLRWPCFL